MSALTDAHAAVAAQFSGLSAQVAGLPVERLKTSSATAIGNQQDADAFPYCFVVPNGGKYVRVAGGAREWQGSIVMRFMLAAAGVEDMKLLHQRYDAWCAAAADALDDAVALDGTAASWGDQEEGALALFDDVDHGWGFEVTLADVVIIEDRTFSA